MDAKLHSIGSCKLDGTDVRNILTSSQASGHLKHPFSITVFEVSSMDIFNIFSDSFIGFSVMLTAPELALKICSLKYVLGFFVE